MPVTHDPTGGPRGRRKAFTIVIVIAAISLIGALVTIVAVPTAFHHEKAKSAVVDTPSS